MLDGWRNPQTESLPTAEMGKRIYKLTNFQQRQPSSADNSSLLASSQLQEQLFPGTQEIGTQEVSVMTLDSFIGKWKSYSRILLKIDVQGVELSVLKGATETLKRCTHVYVECSQVELYVGQALYPDVATFLEQQGYRLQGRCNETIRDGKLIQADYLFVLK